MFQTFFSKSRSIYIKRMFLRNFVKTYGFWQPTRSYVYIKCVVCQEFKIKFLISSTNCLAKRTLFNNNNLLVDVFHEFELSTWGVDFGDGSRSQLVDDLAEDGTIPDYVFVELAWRKFSSQDGFNPFLCFFVLTWVTFGRNLYINKKFPKIK